MFATDGHHDDAVLAKGGDFVRCFVVNEIAVAQRPRGSRSPTIRSAVLRKRTGVVGATCNATHFNAAQRPKLSKHSDEARLVFFGERVRYRRVCICCIVKRRGIWRRWRTQRTLGIKSFTAIDVARFAEVK